MANKRTRERKNKMTSVVNRNLVMPTSCVILNEEEMTYTQGGGEISYNNLMRSKVSCAALATKIVYDEKLKNISTYDLAAEIYAHTFLYYDASAALGILILAGYKDKAMSVLNGISYEDGLDTRTIGGVPYYKIYRTLYALGPDFF